MEKEKGKKEREKETKRGKDVVLKVNSQRNFERDERNRQKSVFIRRQRQASLFRDGGDDDGGRANLRFFRTKSSLPSF